MNTNDSALFAAAKSSMDSLFKEVTGQNIVCWRVRNIDAIVAGTASSSYYPIELTQASVDQTSLQIRQFVGSDVSIPDPTKMEIKLPNGYESMYGFFVPRVKVPASGAGTPNVYLRVSLYSGTNYASRADLASEVIYGIEHGQPLPVIFFDHHRHVETGQTGFKVSFETNYGAVFDGIDILLIVNQYKS